MAERYKLPDEWGGAEIEGFLTDDGLWVDVVVGPVASTLPRVLLTPVKPPTPPEPEPGAYLIGDINAMCVDPDEWRVPALEVGPTSPGWTTYRFTWLTVWEKLGGPDVTITRLVPERVEPPVELPWESQPAGVTRTTVGVEGGQVVDQNIFPGGPYQPQIFMAPAKARAKAAALLAAASRAES